MNISKEDIQRLCTTGSIRWTGYAIKRIIQRNIVRSDVIYILLNGIIIEQYPNDYPFPSCLIMGVTLDKLPLHVVCGIRAVKFELFQHIIQNRKNGLMIL